MSQRGIAVLERAAYAYLRAFHRAKNTLLITLLLLLFPLTAQAVFTTPGSFEVNPDGSAGYTIPIQVPPGTGGMAPQLSLIYNSNAGNGVLGMGWSLAGLSQIGRCPKTIAQDGISGSINFDNNDRYCIDGQRMIVIRGTYGWGNAEYRTHIDTFAWIVSSVETAGNGPAWFKVLTKAGQIIEYGNTADSRIEAQGKSTVLSWAANKISDTKGNYITFTYSEDSANGETVISRIDYTGNGSSAPYTSVQFSYETRSDVSNAYLSGSLIKSTKRMTGIKAYAGPTLVKEYRLSYEQGGSTKLSRLKTLTECDAAGSCLLPVTLTWRDRNNVFVNKGAVASNAYGSWSDKANRTRVMDVNGDGRSDIVLGPEGTGNWYVLRGTNTGYVDDGAWITGAYDNWTASTGRIRVIDVNGDGLDDIMMGPDANGKWYVLRSTGTSFVDTGVWISGLYGTWYDKAPRTWIMDVNGDGLLDIVLGPEGTGNWYVLRSTGAGFVNDGAWITGAYSNWTTSTDRIRVMDVNGDGKQDIVLGPSATSGNWYVLRSTGSSFVDDGVWLSGAYGNWSDAGSRIRSMDVNGDGMQDIVLGPSSSTGHWHVLKSTGSAFLNEGPWISGAYATWDTEPDRIFTTDTNGDGLTDIVLGPSCGSGNWYVLRSTGNSFVDDSAWIGNAYPEWCSLSPRIRSVDIRGDGTNGFLLGPGTGGNWFELDVDPPADQLISISSGLNAITSITYKPLTDSSVYVKGTGSTYPTQDIQSPMYVVSSVSSSDGIGSNVVTSYTYGGAKMDLSGRGFLGFRWTRAVSTDTGIDLTTYYRQDFPYIGLPSQTEKRTTAGVMLSTVVNTYANSQIITGSGTSNFPYISQTQELSYELDGSLVTNTTTSYQYDSYGNATQVVVNSNDGFVKTTANVYANDVTKWLLGRLLRSSVTTVSP